MTNIIYSVYNHGKKTKVKLQYNMLMMKVWFWWQTFYFQNWYDKHPTTIRKEKKYVGFLITINAI